MKSKTTGVLALIATIFTYIWVIGVIWDLNLKGSIETVDQALAYSSNPDTLYTLNYINVGLLTIFTTMMFAGIYEYFKKSLGVWAAIGILFVPIYCTLNLITYISQVTIIPRILSLAETSAYRSEAELLAVLMTQNWDGSAVSVINLMAYALLGIPSIIYGSTMLELGRLGVIAGSLLALSGIGSILAFMGVIMQNSTMASFTLISGFIYAVGLIFITLIFLRSPKSDGQYTNSMEC